MSNGDSAKGEHGGGIERRRVLEVLGVGSLAGVAGCSGGGGGGDGSPSPSGGGGSGGDTTAADEATCSAMGGEFRGYDAGETPIVADFEYPAVLGEPEVQTVGSAIVQATRPVTGVEDVELAIQYNQQLVGNDEPTVAEPDDSSTVNVTTTFGGEEIYVVGGVGQASNILQTMTSLPYEVDGETNYYSTEVSFSRTNTESLSEECEAALAAGARQLAESLSQNPDSTIGESR